MAAKGLKLSVFGLMMTVGISANAVEPAKPTRDCFTQLEAALDWVKSGAVTTASHKPEAVTKESTEQIAAQVEKIRASKGDCAAYDTVAAWLASQD